MCALYDFNNNSTKQILFMSTLFGLGGKNMLSERRNVWVFGYAWPWICYLERLRVPDNILTSSRSRLDLGRYTHSPCCALNMWKLERDERQSSSQQTE